MYGNVRIDDKQRSMQSNKALLNEKTEQITLIENCQINENNKHQIYGDEIILKFENDELNNFEILSGGEIFSTNTGYEKKMEGEKEDLVKLENQNLLKAKYLSLIHI